MSIAVLIVQSLLVLAFALSGGSKLLGAKVHREHFRDDYRYPGWSMFVVGGIEVLAAIALIVGFWVPVLGTLAAAILVVTMAGAVWTHLFRAKQAVSQSVPAAVLLVLALFVTVMTASALTHWLGL